MNAGESRTDRTPAPGFSAEELELLGYLLDGTPSRRRDAPEAYLETEGGDGAWRKATTQAMQPTPAPGIPRRPASDQAPLSWAQERLWFLEQIDPANPVRHLTSSYRLTGPLNVTALAQSLQEVVRRHESLRTTFTIVDGRPMQVVAPSLTLPFPVVDLRGLGQAERETEARRRAGEEGERPFDLRRGPLLRASLLRLDEEDQVLILVMHHIVSDGWSLAVLARELRALYQAFCAGRSSPLPELPMQYADFAVWQRDWLQGDRLRRQLGYWRRQLAGAPPLLDLPGDHPRPPVQTHRGACVELAVPPPLFDALGVLSRRQQVTLFMSLLAAFNVLVSRLTGQEDVVIGAPVAGRIRPEVEGLIGFFLNSLVLRTDLSGDPTFLELLGRVRDVALDAYDHQDVPFEKLLEELKPERDPSRPPLFQVFFNMLMLDDAGLDLSGLRAERFAHAQTWSNFDLTVYVQPQQKGYGIRFVYNADLFGSSRMAEMAAQYQLLLEQIAENPDRRLSQFSLVTPAAAQVLPDPAELLSDAWHGAVHARLAHWARETPDQLAIVDASERWTYRQLDQRCNQLAHYLRAHGVQPQQVVAIYGRRSSALVQAILGVLKAGAAFLILDPAYPAARLAEYLRMAAPTGWIQIGKGPLPAPLEEFLATRACRCRILLSWQEEGDTDKLLSGYSSEEPVVVVGPEDLACVAFTSGSSGVPKGILCRHGPLSHLLPWQERALDLSPSDRFSMLSGLSHDPLQREVLTPLWIGATLHVPDAERFWEPGWLAGWMAGSAITVAHLTPALAQVLTQGPMPDGLLPLLRYAWFVGDILTRPEVDRLTRLAPQVVCVNTYGSTETQRAVSACFVDATPEEGRSKQVYPLGRGIPDVQLLVLSEGLKMAGVGELGEIHIRSPHLALGYLGDQELTAERFLTNPFTGIKEDRLYKTGDLGRYLPDGSVEFAGRRDRQVKIRGFRIELGEIEAALAQHPAVLTSSAVVREGSADDPASLSRPALAGADTANRQLVAYVVLRQAAAPTSTELRDFLAERLPEFMLPSAFVLLESLPLTPNGKIDYAALPAPDRSGSCDTQAAARPQTPTEAALAEIWQEVLGVDQVHVYDNFFDLGGHSLLSIQVVVQVKERLGIRLNPMQLMFHTLGQLAAVCDARMAEAEPVAPPGRVTRLWQRMRRAGSRVQ